MSLLKLIKREEKFIVMTTNWNDTIDCVINLLKSFNEATHTVDTHLAEFGVDLIEQIHTLFYGCIKKAKLIEVSFKISEISFIFYLDIFIVYLSDISRSTV